jgi:putative two-component system response regulator
MAELVECRDDITGGHIERTQRGIKIMLKELAENGIYSEETKGWDVRLLLQSCQLHDVGKIAIDDNILRKPGKLNDEEFTEMKRHTVFGEQIIRKIETMAKESDFLKYAKIFAASHHEKWDGTGYHRGLKGNDIPLLGRIMAIADVYDALTSVRPYKKAFTHEEAVQIITEGSGSQFDPVLVEVFTRAAEQFRS